MEDITQSIDFDSYFHYENNGSGYDDNSSIIYIPKDEHSFFNVFCTVFYSIIFCLSLPGNSFLLWVLWKKETVRNTADFLLLQLTCSDLCFTFMLPFWAVYFSHGWLFGDLACKLVTGGLIFGLYSYMGFLTAMALDRYVAVVHALSSSAQDRRSSRALWASVGIWLFCAAGSLIETVSSETRDDGFDVVLCEQSEVPLAMKLFGAFLQIVLFFLLPFAVITFCYLRIWLTVRRCRLRGRHKAVRLIFGICVGFFVCWVPYNIIIFLDSLMMLGVQSLDAAAWDEVMVYGYYISHTVAYCHCCLNPLFHIFGADRYKKHLPLPCTMQEMERTPTSTVLESTNRNPSMSQDTII